MNRTGAPQRFLGVISLSVALWLVTGGAGRAAEGAARRIADTEWPGVTAALLTTTRAGAPEQRSALVICNAAYRGTPRPTAVHDAIDMAAALRQLGFQVIERHDITRQRMDEAITQFTHQLGSGGAGVFYFSGQGVQVQAVNYLLPVEASLNRESDLAHQAIRLDGVLDHLCEGGNRLNLIILDASRHNPFASSGRSASPGQVAKLAPSRRSGNSCGVDCHPD